MNFQIRIRTNEVFADMEYIKHWLDESPKGFAFEHDISGNHHYHIYLFGLNRKPDPMRKYLAKYLPTKECYAVGITAGKKKETIIDWLAYQYGCTDKLLEPVWHKGVDDKLHVWQLEAAAHYKQQEERYNRRNKVVTEILVVEQHKEKPDRVWERLIFELIGSPDMYDGKQIHQIKSMISVKYLKQLKAVPRPSDLHRYAISLYYIVKYDLHIKEGDIPLDALEEEYLR